MSRITLRRLAVSSCLAGAALLASVLPASAQTLIPESGLEFGRLTPGVPSYVSPTEPGAATVTIIALGRLALRLVDPAPMTSPSGGSIPLDIGGGDAVVRWIGGSTDVLVPGTVTEVRGRLLGTIRIGGTATPAWNQGAGAYRSTIVLQIVAPGT